MIRAENISKSYGKVLVLNKISLELKKSEISVLFGPSGCGKTTLCRNLALLDYPDEGEIKIFDTNYSFPARKRYNHLPYPKINFVYQQLFLWPHLTNRENILLAIENITSEYEERLSFYTNFFGINEILNNYPNQSSLGEKQRVAITRALVLNPEFIFLDEITSAQDIVQTNKIIELLLMFKEKKGIGVLVVTHNLNVISKVADTVFFMQDGKLVEKGNKEIVYTPKSIELKNFLGITV